MLRILQDTQTAAAAACPVEVGTFLYTVGPVLLIAVLAAGLLSNNGDPIDRRVSTLGTACLAFFVYWFVSTELVDQGEIDTADTEWLDIFRPITNSSGLAPYLKEPEDPNFFEGILNTCIEYAYVFDGVVGITYLASVASLGESPNPIKSFLESSPTVWTIVSVVIAFVHVPGVFAGDFVFGVLVFIAILASDLIHGLFDDIGKSVDSFINFVNPGEDLSTMDARTHALLHAVCMVAGSLGSVIQDDDGQLSNALSTPVLAAAAHYVAHSLEGNKQSQLQSAVQLIPLLVQASVMSDGLCTGDGNAINCGCGDRYETIVNLLKNASWPAWLKGAGLVFGSAAGSMSVTNLISGDDAEFSTSSIEGDLDRRGDEDEDEDEDKAERGDGRVVGAEGIRLQVCNGATGAAAVTLKLPTVSTVNDVRP